MSLTDDLRAALDPTVLFEAAFGLEPLSWQKVYLRATGNVAVVKGRQVGASTAAAAAAIHLVLYHHDANAIVVSPSQRQSQEIAKRARAGLRRLGVRLIEDSASVLRLPNGSRVVSLPGTSRSVRGWTARLLILDEAAYLEDPTITAARALVATGGRTVVQSTPADEVGAFHSLIVSGDPDWLKLTVRTDEVATVSPEFLAAERRAMSPDAYSTEYECQFGKAGATLFSIERIDRLFRQPEGNQRDEDQRPAANAS